MRKLTLVVAMLMMVLMIAAPALAQEKGKGKGKGGKKDKATPETGGTLVDASILGLGAGALMVGGGLVVRRIVRQTPPNFVPQG
jgi:hypothetical protein